MTDLQPPKAPELYTKKKGFFSRLFGNKKQKSPEVLDNKEERESTVDMKIDDQVFEAPLPPGTDNFLAPNNNELDKIRQELGIDDKIDEKEIQEEVTPDLKKNELEIKQESLDIEVKDDLVNNNPTIEPKTETQEEKNELKEPDSQSTPLENMNWNDELEEKKEEIESDWTSDEKIETKEEEKDKKEEKAEWLHEEHSPTHNESENEWNSHESEIITNEDSVESIWADNTPPKHEEDNELKNEESTEVKNELEIENKEEVTEDLKQVEEASSEFLSEEKIEIKEAEEEKKEDLPSLPQIEIPEPVLKTSDIEEITKEKETPIEQMPLTPEILAGLSGKFNKKTKKLEIKNVKVQEKKPNPKLVKAIEESKQKEKIEEIKLNIDEIKEKLSENEEKLNTLKGKEKEILSSIKNLSKKNTNNTNEKHIKNLKNKIEKLKEPLIPKLKEEEYFSLSSGNKIRDLSMLISELEKMGESEFKNYCDEKHNHISSWIELSLRQQILAKQIKNTTNKQKIISLLKAGDRRISEKQLKVEKEIKELYDDLEQVEKIKDETKIDLNGLFSEIKPNNIKSLLKTLDLVIDYTKLNLDDIIIKNKEEFNLWIKEFIIKQVELEKERANRENEELTLKLNEATKETLANQEKFLGEIRNKFENQENNIEKLDVLKKELILRSSNIVNLVDEKTKQLENTKGEIEEERKNKINELETREKELENLQNHVENERNWLDKEKTEFSERKNKKLEEEKLVLESINKEVIELNAHKEILEKNLKDIEEEHRIKIKEEFDKKENQFYEQKHNFEEYRKKELKQIEDERHRLENEKLATDKLKKQLIMEEERARLSIEAHKEEIRADLDEIKQIDQNLTNVENNIKQHKEEIEVAGFDKYIQMKLKNSKKQNLAISSLLNNNQRITESEISKNFYELIEKCHDQIKNGKTELAKNTYNNLKNSFTTTSFQDKEREEIHSQLRELYDDLHLAILQEN